MTRLMKIMMIATAIVGAILVYTQPATELPSRPDNRSGTLGRSASSEGARRPEAPREAVSGAGSDRAWIVFLGIFGFCWISVVMIEWPSGARE
jgi:hypothetical protein